MSFRISRVFALSALAALSPLAACASDIGGELNPGPMNGTGKITATESAGGAWIIEVDASASDTWVYFAFASKAEVAVADPMASSAWDLAFERFKIATNGGVSGRAGMEVCAMPGAEFERLEAAPSSGWIADAADSGDMDSDPDLAFLVPNRASDTGWYSYNPMMHTLAPAEVVYVVRAADGRKYKVELLGYYDGAGSAGHVSFRFGEL